MPCEATATGSRMLGLPHGDIFIANFGLFIRLPSEGTAQSGDYTSLPFPDFGRAGT